MNQSSFITFFIIFSIFFWYYNKFLGRKIVCVSKTIIFFWVSIGNFSLGEKVDFFVTIFFSKFFYWLPQVISV